MSLEYNSISTLVDIKLANGETIQVGEEANSEKYVMSVDIIEELSYISNNPLGRVSSNTCDIELYDNSKELVPNHVGGVYNSLLDNSAKFKVYAKVDGVEEALGEYYVTEWEGEQDFSSSTVKISGVDLIGYLYDKVIAPIPVNEDTSVEEYYELLFQAVGLSSGQYSISSALNQKFKFSVVNGSKFGDIINTVAEGTVTCVFVDRQGVIRVEDALWSGNKVGNLSGSENVYEGQFKNNGLSDYNGVILKYNEATKTEESELLIELKGYKLMKDVEELKGIESEDAIYCIDYVDVQNSNNVGLTATCSDIEYTQNSIDLTIDRASGQDMIVDIGVYGKKVVETSCELKHTIRTDKVDNFLTIDNKLIQSKSYADWYLNKLTSYLEKTKFNLQLKAMCSPALKLGDKVDVSITTANLSGTYKVISNKITLGSGCRCDVTLVAE